jgi:hypothetical protein
MQPLERRVASVLWYLEGGAARFKPAAEDSDGASPSQEPGFATTSQSPARKIIPQIVLQVRPGLNPLPPLDPAACEPLRGPEGRNRRSSR